MVYVLYGVCKTPESNMSPARIGDKSIGVHEGARQGVCRGARLLILSRISSPQNAQLIAHAHRLEARREILLIEVDIEATLPRSQPKVERKETGWHLMLIPPRPANNGLRGLFSWRHASRRSMFLLNFPPRGVWGRWRTSGSSVAATWSLSKWASRTISRS